MAEGVVTTALNSNDNDVSAGMRNISRAEGGRQAIFEHVIY
jgi:hypothetical protein